MDTFSYLLGKKTSGGGSSSKIYETTIDLSTGTIGKITKDLTANNLFNGTIKANFEFMDGSQKVTGTYYYNILFVAEISNQSVILLTIYDNHNFAFIDYTYSPLTGELSVYNG